MTRTNQKSGCERKMAEPWYEAYTARFSDSSFGSDAIGLFALGLVYGIEDLDSLGAEIITGGGNDKKCDLVYLDVEESRAIIAQCYLASNDSKPAAPSNKAADLGTAIGWLLNRQIDQVPDSIRGSAAELRDAIKNRKIDEIGIWYVHNLPESKNVNDELKTVEESALNAVRSICSTSTIRISAREIGRKTLKELFEDSRAPILVPDKFSFRANSSFEIHTDSWSSLVTTIPGRLLHQLFNTNKEKLFSANVRDYLGSRASDSNINNGIKETAEKDPENFWVFNNGITAIVNDFYVKKNNKSHTVNFTGISIVNGAQTTGAIGNLDSEPDKKLFAPIRLIKTKDENVVYDIIKFNNSQNKISASDFRSTDLVRRRLKKEFDAIPDTEYEAGRRGGASDAIRRRPNLLPSYTVGQALAAFHGDPVLSYDKKSEIWVNDTNYGKLFNDRTTGRHIVFSYSLLKCVLDTKTRLLSANENSLTEIELATLDFFQMKGSIYLLVAAISDCLESIIGRKIANKFSLQFKDNISATKGVEVWQPIVDVLLPLTGQLQDGFTNKRIRADKAASAITKFRGVVGAIAIANKAIFEVFAAKVEA
jgi:hypothetical protein